MDVKVNALEIAKLMKAHGVRNVFVRKAGEFVGMVRDIDLVLKVMVPQLDLKTVTAEDIMFPQLPSIGIEAGISEIARLMADTGVRRVAITEKGEIIGSITAENLLRVLSFVSRAELECVVSVFYLPNVL